MVCPTSPRIEGRRSWRLKRDKDSHREYALRTLIISDDREDGPYTILNTPGLSSPGSPWVFGNDNDPDARCKRNADVHYHEAIREGQACLYWLVDQVFSTDYDDNCDEDSTNPILMKPKISGSFSKYSEEGRKDRLDKDILNSSFEFIHGPQNEWDANRPTVRVESNEALLKWNTLCDTMDGLNSVVMWCRPVRTIKLSGCTWEQRFYGTAGTGTTTNCAVYYKRVLEFEHRRDGYDRKILDEGTKMLRGSWIKNPGGGVTYTKHVDIAADANAHKNPANFIKAIDTMAKPMRVMLDGLGMPLDAVSAPVVIPPTVGSDRTEKYLQYDFITLLGNIPAYLGEACP